MQMIRVNLLPKKQGIKVPKLPIGSIIGVLACIALGYYLWVVREEQNQQTLADLQKSKKNFEQEYNQKVAEKQAELDRLRGRISMLQQKVNLVKNLIGTDHVLPWTSTMEDLSDVVTGVAVWVTRFTAELSNKVTVSGTAKEDINAVGNLMERLKNHNHFSDVSVSSIVKGKLGETTIYTFQMSCRLEKGAGYRE